MVQIQQVVSCNIQHWHSSPRETYPPAEAFCQHPSMVTGYCLLMANSRVHWASVASPAFWPGSSGTFGRWWKKWRLAAWMYRWQICRDHVMSSHKHAAEPQRKVSTLWKEKQPNDGVVFVTKCKACIMPYKLLDHQYLMYPPVHPSVED